MKTTEAPISYYKSNDNHVYKRLKSGYVLHVQYATGCMNILSPAVWDDIIDITNRAHAPLSTITKEQFEQKAKAALTVITSSLNEY